jgi:hypothetical protein
MRKLIITIFIGLLGGLGLLILALKVFAHFHGAAIGQGREETSFTNGDIIFQTSLSGQSEAIQLATHSKYSHCGLIFWDDGQCFVAEASKQVTLTPIDDFIKRGKDGKYVVKRLKNSDEIFTTPGILEKMTTLYYDKFANKPYDIYFEWTNDKIYCSELVWKIYKETVNIEIGELEELGDFDLTSDKVGQKMRERYKDNIPVNEKVISPGTMFDSDKLITVMEK